MDSTTTLVLAIAAFLIAITGFSVYTAFGPPSKKLADPFDEHED
ncbi:MAG: photosystem II reaction center protein PsbN [Coleofasciculaceae cyanobacterium SM2_3_26]|nr:photosystem II reaction center protein PsbN [Coleofasciculaceae cyanobacterium SM2_3_26]